MLLLAEQQQQQVLLLHMLGGGGNCGGLGGLEPTERRCTRILHVHVLLPCTAVPVLVPGMRVCTKDEYI